MDPVRDDPHLTPEQRRVVRALRQAARIVGHAALPAEYRAPAFVFLASIIVAGARGPADPRDLTPADRCPEAPRRSW